MTSGKMGVQQAVGAPRRPLTWPSTGGGAVPTLHSHSSWVAGKWQPFLAGIASLVSTYLENSSKEEIKQLLESDWVSSGHWAGPGSEPVFGALDTEPSGAYIPGQHFFSMAASCNYLGSS